VQELKESDAEIDVWGNTAVASYAWEMKYEMGDASYHESGRDLFVFKRDVGKVAGGLAGGLSLPSGVAAVACCPVTR